MSIANELQRIANAKKALAGKIVEMGLSYVDDDTNTWVEVSVDENGNPNDTIDELAEALENITVVDKQADLAENTTNLIFYHGEGKIVVNTSFPPDTILKFGDHSWVESSTEQLDVQAGYTITPTKEQQTVVPAFRWTTDAVYVAPIPDEYVKVSDITKDEDDVTVDENKVDVPAGYYPNGISKIVPALNVLKENIDVLQQEPVGTDENSIVGTWVFKDELQIPDDFYGNEHHFSYSVYDIPVIGNMEYTALRFYDDGIKYIEYITADGDCDSVYQEGVGWLSDMQARKTITIGDEPIDETFIAWLKTNATRQEVGNSLYVMKDVNAYVKHLWIGIDPSFEEALAAI